MTFSARIRDRLKAELAPCPTCGHARSTVTALAELLGQPASSVGRYLAGGKPSVGLLDAAEAHVSAHEDGMDQDEAREFLEV